MALGIIGKKLGMTQVFSPDGAVIPVTVVQVGPCTVVQKKTGQKDGYEALKIGFAEKKLEKMIKPLQGQFKKCNGKGYAVLQEFRFDATEKYEIGDMLTAGIFEEGERVLVSGISKGKGFAGNIKRWGFHRGPMTHGSKFHRAMGSSGMSAWPAKVLKGKKMPGHLGVKKVSLKNVLIVDKREDENLIFVKGAVPGGKNALVTVTKL